MSEAAPRRRRVELLWGAETFLASTFLAGTAALPVSELLLRNLIDFGITGATVIRINMTLWVGFLGAMLASRRGQHLRISVGFEGLPQWLQPWAETGVAAAGLAVSAGLTWGAYDFVVQESWSQVWVAGVPIWIVETIFPLCFAVVSLRFLTRLDNWRQRAVAMLGLAVAGAVWLNLIDVEGALLWTGLGLLLAAFVFGAPIFVLLGGAAVLLFASEDIPTAASHVEAYRLVSAPAVPAIPLFALTGFLLTRGSASTRLVRVFEALFAWLPGGMALATCLVCGFFTAFTGASGVTILALGGLLLPALQRSGYGEKFSLGLVTSTGSIGLLLPPSLAVILYGVVARVSVLDMLVAAIVPGLVMIAAISVYGAWKGIRRDVRRTPFDMGEALAALWAAKWDLLVPMIALGTIFGGLATLVEAAAITAVYVLLVEFLIAGFGVTARKLPEILADCSSLIGGIFIILAVAMGLTNYLVDAEVPQRMAEWIGSAVGSRLVFLLLLNLFLLAVGCMMDVYSAIVVVVPLILPLSQAYGVHPLHLGVIFLANLELGYLTPPVGMNLFLSAYRFGRPVTEIFRSVIAFLAVLALVVLVVTYVPVLTLWAAP